MIRILVIAYTFLAVAIAERQLKLEDIERDNLASERGNQNEPLPPAREPNPYVTPPKPHTPLEIQYGFRPMNIQPQPMYNDGQPQYFPAQDQLSETPQHQFALPQYYLSYQTSQPNKQPLYITANREQQYVHNPPQYQPLQYISDNHLPQDSRAHHQGFYTPQYYYLQQFPAATNTIQAIVDPKGGIQYVMYVPEHLLNQQSEVPDARGKFPQQLYNPQQYIPQDLSDKGLQYQYLETTPQSDPSNYADAQYIPQPRLPPTHAFVPQKNEPKSLLDSYVPSILQVQYYKQQQAEQAKAIRGHSIRSPRYKFPYKTEVPDAASAQSFSLRYLTPPPKP